MLPLLVALHLLPMACGTQLPTRVTATARTRAYTITVDTLGTDLTVPGAADSVWRVLPAVYESLGLPVHENDARLQRLGTCWARVRRRAANLPLSRLLDCGEVRSVPNADRLEVELLALTTVKAGAQGTSISVFVLGSAAESAGSANRMWCVSTGVLEGRIRDGVAARM